MTSTRNFSHRDIEVKTEFSPFEMISQAAKQKDEKMLASALKLVKIDVLSEYKFETPISKLACENNKRAVNFLIKFGSSLLDAIRGYAQGGYIAEATSLLEKVSPSNAAEARSTIQFGLGLGGHIEKAYAFLEKAKFEYPAEVNDILLVIGVGLAVSGHKKKAYDFLEKVELEHPAAMVYILTKMPMAFFKGGYFQDASICLDKLVNKDAVEAINCIQQMQVKMATVGTNGDDLLKPAKLKALTMIDRYSLRKNNVYRDLQRDRSFFGRKAINLSRLMRGEQLTYQQALAWGQPQIRLLLTQGIALLSNNKTISSLQKLPVELFLYIVSYLSLMPASDMCDLSNKFSQKICRARFFNHPRKDQTLLVASRSMVPFNIKNQPFR